MRSLFCTTMLLMAAGMAAPALADEGMWTYDNFPTAKMQAKYGWAPDAAWLEHARLGSIRLTLGCSASLVSSDGLVMTNHHCARECVSDLADAQHDYIANGFYAASLADEKKCPAMEANQLVKITDVTKQVEAATAGKSERAFHEAERAIKAQIESACGTAADVRCQVVTLYAGGVYNLYKYKRYQDVRVVFAPEESAAFFGGDPDNFTFPRFDLDTAFVRIYDNGKPLHTDTYLKFASKGVKQGDIALTSGNPGSTEREDTLAQLEFQRDEAQPFVLTMYSELRGILTEFATKGAEQARTSKTLLFSIENSLKAYKGRQLALVQGSIIADKARTEADFRKRVAADPKLAASFGGAWDAVAAAVAHNRGIYVRNAHAGAIAAAALRPAGSRGPSQPLRRRSRQTGRAASGGIRGRQLPGAAAADRLAVAHSRGPRENHAHLVAHQGTRISGHDRSRRACAARQAQSRRDRERAWSTAPS